MISKWTTQRVARSAPVPARHSAPAACRLAAILLVGLTAAVLMTSPAARAHPMGNFAICHYARITAGGHGRLNIRYVLDRAEIPTVSEKAALCPAGGDGFVTEMGKRAYLKSQADLLVPNLDLEADGKRLPLAVLGSDLALSPGAGGLQTLKVTFDLQANAPESKRPMAVSYADHNYEERTGWKEIVLAGTDSAAITGSALGAADISKGLSVYPKDVIPPQDVTAQFNIAFRGPAEAVATAPNVAPIVLGATPLASALTVQPAAAMPAAIAPAVATATVAAPSGSSTPRDPFTQAIATKKLTPLIVAIGLVIAFVYGGIHALSPGHGKTIVGAYLVGSRGTPWHAVYLGATVTITHTLGVFALGLVTLFASKYVVPERLYPILGVVSGGAIIILGFNLFIQRLTSVMGFGAHAHREAMSMDGQVHTGNPLFPHSHGGGLAHSHLPPGADGAPITWISLLTLGISGGLLPCPSALVVLLSAVALHRLVYGLVLVTAFSLGLAGTLTIIGLLFLHAGRVLSRSKLNLFSSPVMRIVPVFSALFVVGAGAFLVHGAMQQGGGRIFATGAPSAAALISIGTPGGPSLGAFGAWAILGLGLIFGLKHATEVDHVIAVSTIVSEHRNLARAALVGGLWGVGHTTSLMVVGLIVLGLRVAIPERVAEWLEFGVAVMIITLAALALRRSLLGRSELQNLPSPTDRGTDTAPTPKKIGIKPFIVGMIHGLAGSGTLTLLVLTQIKSPVVGFVYLTVFGIGSIFGMLLMSGLVGLPFAVSARKLTGINLRLQAVASVFSLAFGFWYAYQTGIANGLLSVHF